MAGESIVIMDAAGRIVWANRAAHERVGLGPGGLLGRTYLEFCPPETHRELLDLHRRKLSGEQVRFRIEVGRPMDVTSGPVKLGRKTYLYAVGRDLTDPAAGDDTALALLAAGEMLGGAAARLDLNACVLGALKDEAALLKGRVSLEPGTVPVLRGPAWPLRAVLRAFLRRMSEEAGRVSISTGADARRTWVQLRPESGLRLPKEFLARCRKTLRPQGGECRGRRGTVRVTFPLP